MSPLYTVTGSASDAAPGEWIGIAYGDGSVQQVWRRIEDIGNRRQYVEWPSAKGVEMRMILSEEMVGERLGRHVRIKRIEGQ